MHALSDADAVLSRHRRLRYLVVPRISIFAESDKGLNILFLQDGYPVSRFPGMPIVHEIMQWFRDMLG
jgi:hypothetical protein